MSRISIPKLIGFTLYSQLHCCVIFLAVQSVGEYQQLKKKTAADIAATIFEIAVQLFFTLSWSFAETEGHQQGLRGVSVTTESGQR